MVTRRKFFSNYSCFQESPTNGRGWSSLSGSTEDQIRQDYTQQWDSDLFGPTSRDARTYACIQARVLFDP